MADELQAPIPEAAPPAAEGTISGIAPQAVIGAPVNMMTPDGELTGVHPEQVADALDAGYTHAPDEAVHAHFQQEKYGTTEQMAKTALEGAASGLISSTITNAAETKLGIATPEDIRGREQANPWTHGLSEVGGFGAGMLLGTGEAQALTKAASIVPKVAESGSFIAKVGADAAKAAFEGVLYQMDQEGGKLFKENPEQSASHAIADIGLSGVMGGVFGGAIGAALRKTGLHPDLATAHGIPEGEPAAFVSAVDKPGIEAGDFKTIIRNSQEFKPKEKEGILAGLSKRKANADEIESIAKNRNYPVLEGMISDDKLVQKAEDSLINGAPTFSGIKRQALYKDAYSKASGDVESALGEGSTMSKAEIGNNFKDTLTSQIKEENEPIKAAYDRIKAHTEHIPLSLDTGRIITELEAMPEAKSAFSGNIIKGTLEGLGNAQTVDDLKSLRSSMNGSLGFSATPNERRIAGIVSDKLKQLEEDSIEKFALHSAVTAEDKAAALALPALRKEADAAYKPFIQKLQKLSKALGKENIGGAQGAIQFINNLTPEQVTQRLFTKNNSQFLKFFQKEFPEQAAQMQAYQRGILREGTTNPDGVLSNKLLFNKINELEPEIQQALFSKEELAKLKDAETYLRSFPKNFNPSGTDNMSAFRDFFTSPLKTASANARDFAIEKFIKSVGASPKAQAAVELAKATVAGDKLATRAIKSVFNGVKEAPMGALIPLASHRDKLSKIVETYKADPSKMFGQNDSNPVPEYAQAFAATTGRAVQYLGAMKPDTSPKAPMDSKLTASTTQTAAYNRALDIAQQPLNVLARMKAGTLTPQDVTTLKTIYPQMYDSISKKIMNQVVETAHKGSTVPYTTRLQLSMFLGWPLDSTMTQPAMAAIQMQNQAKKQEAAAQQQPQKPPSASSTKGLKTISDEAQTPRQSREAARAKRSD